MSRADKLAKLKSSQSLESMVVFSNGDALLEQLEKQFTRFKEILGSGVDVNADELLDQLEQLGELSEDVKDLRKTIADFSFPEIPESVEIKGLQSLINITKQLANKKEAKPEKLDLKPLNKMNSQLDTLIDKIGKLSVPEQGKTPGDYVPMRRVMKVGNNLMFDDSFYTGGGGGGSSSSGSSGTSYDGIIRGSGGGSATVTGGKLDVNASASLSGTSIPIAGATSAVGVAIVDNSGNQINSFGGGTQYADGAARGTATGTIALVDDGTNVQSAKGDSDGTAQVNQTKVAGTAIDTNSGTKSAGTQRVVLATDQPQLTNALKVDGSAVTQPVSGSVSVSGVATNAAQTDKSQFTKLTDGTDTALITASGEQNVIATAQPGVDIGDVTINNASGGSAVNVQDGGNSLTVDAPVGTPAFVRLSDGASAITALPVTDNSGSLTVDYATTGSGTATGALRVELPTNGTGVVGLNAGSAIVGKVGIDQTTPGTTNLVALTAETTKVIGVTRSADGSGNLLTSTSNALDVNLKTSSITMTVNDAPITTGGLSKSHLVSGASTNATNVKASAGQVYAITAFNTNASPRYLKFHNTAGAPTAGTAVTDTFLVPGNASGAGLVLNIDKGIAFSTGIAFTTVTGIADADTAAVGSGDLVINIYYK
jgi:hypothetical protein